MDKTLIAQQIHRAMQIFAQGLHLDDSQAMEIADLYPEWSVGKKYEAGIILKHGENAYSETQLYTVLQEHTSQADWTPPSTASLYKAIGFDDSGVPIWTQPLGASDAYMKGDKVSHVEKFWTSEVDSNVWEPGIHGWEELSK